MKTKIAVWERLMATVGRKELPPAPALTKQIYEVEATEKVTKSRTWTKTFLASSEQEAMRMAMDEDLFDRDDLEDNDWEEEWDDEEEIEVEIDGVQLKR